MASVTERRAKRRAEKAAEASRTTTMVGVNRFIPWMFSAPTLAVVGVVMAFPVGYAFYRSLFEISPLQAESPFIGFGNYVELARDPLFWGSLVTSLIFVTGCAVMGGILAVAFAFALSRLVGGLRWVRSFIIFPYIVSTIAVGVMFRLLFNSDFGLPNQALELMGLPGLSWLGDPRLAMFVVIVAQVWSDLPLAILLIFGGLMTIDQSYLDAASVDGATGWKRMLHVSLPLVAPQLVLSMIFISYRALTTLGTILALTGGGPGRATETLTLRMLRVGFSEFDTSKALAIVVVIFVLNATIALLYLGLQRRWRVG